MKKSKKIFKLKRAEIFTKVFRTIKLLVLLRKACFTLSDPPPLLAKSHNKGSHISRTIT